VIGGRQVRCLSAELQFRFRLSHDWTTRDEHWSGACAHARTSDAGWVVHALFGLRLSSHGRLADHGRAKLAAKLTQAGFGA
jgi:hypothetical protein